MKKLLILSVAALVSVSAFTFCGHSGSSSLKTDEDTLSYWIGVNMGIQLKNDPYIQENAFMAGLKKGYSGKDTVTQQKLMEIQQEFFNVKLPEKNLQESEAYLLDIEKKNKNVQKTESGILYEIIEPGSDLKAISDNDEVKVIYEGKLRNGNIFDSSKERGDTVAFALNRVIAGWTEGMKLVGKGGKIMLWIPSELAYGKSGNRSIGPNEALQFEVELVDVIPATVKEDGTAE